MATLNLGATVSLPIVGHEIYTVVSQHNTQFKVTFLPATAQGNAGMGNARSFGPMGQNVALGPYSVPGTLTIENINILGGSALTYTYGSAMFVADDALYPGLVVVSASAPNNADGRADGTIYIKTA